MIDDCICLLSLLIGTIASTELTVKEFVKIENWKRRKNCSSPCDQADVLRAREWVKVRRAPHL